ncbi:MAG: hypothetical protein LUH01_13280 [Parabacteroides gordonii]|nr:hypothetical protein [Parabacteroides gordonii]
MVEIESCDLRVSFQLVSPVAALEESRGREPRQLLLLFPGSFLVACRQCGAVGNDQVLPAAATDQDNDFFQRVGFGRRQVKPLEKRNGGCIHNVLI